MDDDQPDNEAPEAVSSANTDYEKPKLPSPVTKPFSDIHPSDDSKPVSVSNEDSKVSNNILTIPTLVPSEITAPTDEVSLSSEPISENPPTVHGNNSTAVHLPPYNQATAPADSPEKHMDDNSNSTLPPIPSSTIAPKSKKNRVFMTILVVIVALALIAGAVYWYTKHKNSTNSTSKSSTANTSQQSMTTKVQPANVNNVNQTSQNIDVALNKVNDTKDFSNNDLADSTLGL